MELKLYHYWRSSASWRVRLGLAAKRITYQEIAVDLLQGAEKNQEYKALNPSGYVPCLVVDGKPLGESMAILEWLEEVYPNPSILPGDAFQRAGIRRFAESINSGIQPLHNMDVMKRVSEDKQVQLTWNQHWIARGLTVCEQLLALDGDPKARFCFGDTPTFADICLIPQCYAANRNSVRLEDYPRIHQIYEYAKTTQLFIDTCPEKFQPTP